MVASVVLLGHSFIRRLRDFTSQNADVWNLKLNPEVLQLSFRCQGGLTLPRLIHERADLYNFQGHPPSIVYLQIGGNDLSARDPEEVVRDLLSFASYLHEGVGTPLIIVGQLLLRSPNVVGQRYNDKVITCNKLLNEQLVLNNIPGIIFWKHRGFWNSLHHISHDGVHLNQEGLWKYYRSVRSAILHAYNLLGNICSF